MLYLARYLKGGSINPKQIEHCSAKTIRFRYLYHRDKRTKTLSLSPDVFLQRFLAHVPAMGVHIVDVKTPGLTPRDMVLFCRTCGEPLKLSHRVWRGQQKGNSINKASPGSCGGSYVQQVDAAVLASVSNENLSIEIPP